MFKIIKRYDSAKHGIIGINTYKNECTINDEKNCAKKRSHHFRLLSLTSHYRLM